MTPKPHSRQKNFNIFIPHIEDYQHVKNQSGISMGCQDIFNKKKINKKLAKNDLFKKIDKVAKLFTAKISTKLHH